MDDSIFNESVFCSFNDGNNESVLINRMYIQKSKLNYREYYRDV